MTKKTKEALGGLAIIAIVVALNFASYEFGRYGLSTLEHENQVLRARVVESVRHQPLRELPPHPPILRGDAIEGARTCRNQHWTGKVVMAGSVWDCAVAKSSGIDKSLAEAESK